MPENTRQQKDSGSTRREFLKTSAAASTAALLAASFPVGVHAQGSDTLKVGVIGCGGRGTGAAVNCADSAPGVKITALGDLFKDRLDACHGYLQQLGDRLDAPPARQFVGFDAYRQVLAEDVDLVILATPPGFRPLHMEAAVAAGKHVFAEKPVAVDPAGVRRVIRAAEAAKEAGLGIVAGTQRRHQTSYLETIRRIRDGAIGDVVAAQCYWNQGGLWAHARKSVYSDMEWQVRNWLYFTWLSGDHIVEQHVHNLDVMNWILGSPPLKAIGMGGRQARTEPIYGNIYDHFAVEYEYPGGVRVHSMCRQIDGSASRVGERIVGTAGIANPAGTITGAESWDFEEDPNNPYVQEHTDLIHSIRSGQPLNEGKQVAQSTLTAILGRMSAYTGKEVTWDFALNSKLDTLPTEWGFHSHPVDGVAVPGRTPLL
jgi:predicted dehydrogenase